MVNLSTEEHVSMAMFLANTSIIFYFGVALKN